jgi:class I fructose-bisphosphate aldolase/fructose-bisphosphate aldolase/2-amino-3,7-dideoxy-D-threo-hept-6-ulosonate synthase
MSGVAIKLGKLFSGGKNAVVIAADHGEFEGPIPGMVNIAETLGKVSPGVDGLLLSPGILRASAGVFSHKGAPLAVMRLNWSTTYCEGWGYSEGRTVRAISPRTALLYGAEIALVSLTLKTGSEKTDARNVEVFCSLAREAHEVGLPVIGEYFPVAYKRLSPGDLRDEVRSSARILAELGADAIKTFYTVGFAATAAGCPVPILGLGGERMDTPLEALQLAQDLVEAGARGVVFGRNALQADDPLGFQEALCHVVKDGVAARQAASELAAC